jgi:hypothetical protein
VNGIYLVTAGDVSKNNPWGTHGYFIGACRSAEEAETRAGNALLEYANENIILGNRVNKMVHPTLIAAVELRSNVGLGVHVSFLGEN